MQPLGNCIGPTIRIGREILFLPYAGFFLLQPKVFMFACNTCQAETEWKWCAARQSVTGTENIQVR